MGKNEDERKKPGGQPVDGNYGNTPVYKKIDFTTEDTFRQGSGLYRDLAKLAEEKKKQMDQLKMETTISKEGLIEIEVESDEKLTEILGKHGNNTFYIKYTDNHPEIVEENGEGEIIQTWEIISKSRTGERNLSQYTVRDNKEMVFYITADGKKVDIDLPESTES